MAQIATFSTTTATSLPVLVRQMMVLVRERFEAKRARDIVRAELNHYSDRELADMGLCRSDIEDVVHQRFAR